MSAPTPVAETYTSCVGATFTIGTAPDDVVLKVIEGGITETVGVDEMTNSGSSAAYEDVPTIKKVTGSFTAAFVSGMLVNANAGKIYAVVIANGTSPTFTGNVRINNVNTPLMNVKEGLKVKFDITSQGGYTIA